MSTKARSYILHDALLVDWINVHISDTLQQEVQALLEEFPVQMITSSHLRLNERMADILRPFDIPLTIELFDVGSSVRWWFVTYTPSAG